MATWYVDLEQPFEKTSNIKDNRINVQAKKNKSVKQTNVNKLIKACESKDWQLMFSLIETDPSLVNTVTEQNGKSLLHYVAQSGQVALVNKLLNYPNCDLKILILVARNNVTISNEVRATIEWNVHRIKQERISKPILTDATDSNSILLSYTIQAIQRHIGSLQWKAYSPKLFNQFVEILEYVYYSVRQETVSILNELLRRELYFCQNRMKEVKSLDNFYQELTRLYTDSISNDLLVRELTTKGTNNYGISFTLINAVLMYYPNLKRSVKTTYRGVRIEQREIDSYVVGREFAWLSFMSCSERVISQDFIGNCWFQIDNSLECIWSPRVIGDISPTDGGNEYVYPSGAQFRVIKVEKIGVKICVSLRLICSIKQESIFTSGVLYNGLKSVLINIVESVKEFYPKVLAQLEVYKKDSEALFESNKEIEKLNDSFVETIKVTKKEVLMEVGKLAYNCSVCKQTCHEPCGDIRDRACSFAIKGKVGSCEICPGKCHYTTHQRHKFKIEITEVSREPKKEYLESKKSLQEKGETQKIVLSNSENNLKETLVKLKQFIREFKETADELDNVLGTKQDLKRRGREKRIEEITQLKGYIATINMNCIK